MSPNTLTASAVNAFPDLEIELASTRRMLERLPDDKWTWQPHEKSMTLARAATHIIEVLRLAESTVSAEGFDLNTEHMNEPATRDELLQLFDAHADALKAAVSQAQPETWSEAWQLTRGSQVLRSLPRNLALRFAGLNHVVHHRGQLSVYLRLLHTPVPGLYGPSADEH